MVYTTLYINVHYVLIKVIGNDREEKMFAIYCGFDICRMNIYIFFLFHSVHRFLEHCVFQLRVECFRKYCPG